MFGFLFVAAEDPGAPKPVGPTMTPAIGPALEVCVCMYSVCTCMCVCVCVCVRVCVCV